MTQQKKQPLDMMKAAIEKKQKYVRFDIQIDNENTIEAIMTAPEIFAIAEEQEIVYQVKYAECVEKGMAGKPVNKSDWEKDKAERIRSLEQSERTYTREDVDRIIKRDEPTDLAEQVAKKISRFHIVNELMPKMIKIHDGEQTRYMTKEEQETLKELIRTDMKLFTYLSGKWMELINEVFSLEEQAKNLSAEASSANGKSKKESPGGTQDTAVPSTQD